MRRWLLIILSISLFCSCEQKNKVKVQIKPINHTSVNPSHSTITAIYDSVVTLFGDTAYKLKLNIIDKKSENEAKPNAILTLKKNQEGRAIILLTDSLYVRDKGYMVFKDFNNDHIKDLLIYNTSGGRANPTYYLYLIYPRTHELLRVKGFEKLPSPEVDTAENIIISIGLGGQSEFCSFYRIKLPNKITNLGHSFESPYGNDKLKFEAAIKKIKKEKRHI